MPHAQLNPAPQEQRAESQDSSTGANPYKELRRTQKAVKLADFIGKYFSSELAAELDVEDWAKVAKNAGVNPPSLDTCKLVLEMLRNREVARV